MAAKTAPKTLDRRLADFSFICFFEPTQVFIQTTIHLMKNLMEGVVVKKKVWFFFHSFKVLKSGFGDLIICFQTWTKTQYFKKQNVFLERHFPGIIVYSNEIAPPNPFLPLCCLKLCNTRLIKKTYLKDIYLVRITNNDWTWNLNCCRHGTWQIAFSHILLAVRM